MKYRDALSMSKWEPGCCAKTLNRYLNIRQEKTVKEEKPVESPRIDKVKVEEVEAAVIKAEEAKEEKTFSEVTPKAVNRPTRRPIWPRWRR